MPAGPPLRNQELGVSESITSAVDRVSWRRYASDVNLEPIRRRVSGSGFHPFALRTSDGREYAVRHPEMVLVAPRSLAVVDRDGEIVTLDALHIVAIKNLRARTNGAAKR